MMRNQFLTVAALLTAFTASGWAQKINPDSVLIQDFENRVKDYLKLQKQVDATLPALKSTISPHAINEHERDLAEGILKARPGAAQGAIFTPEIAAEFRRLIALGMQGSNAKHIRQSLLHAEPDNLVLRVGDTWPVGVPLQSMPPTLLMNLPPLDSGVDYRVVARSLALRDTQANLIIDFVPNAIH